ncbi:MAG: hypothetical protein P8Y03_31215, partial [Anaerolineales bacterium]
ANSGCVTTNWNAWHRNVSVPKKLGRHCEANVAEAILMLVQKRDCGNQRIASQKRLLRKLRIASLRSQ